MILTGKEEERRNKSLLPLDIAGSSAFPTGRAKQEAAVHSVNVVLRISFSIIQQSINCRFEAEREELKTGILFME